MSACIEKQQIQFFVILLPDHQPIWFNVAFLLPAIFAAKDVRTIFGWKRTGFCENADGFL